MAWRSLSTRENGRDPDGPYEGVPPHLAAPLVHWLEGVFGFRGGAYEARHVLTIAAALRVSLSESNHPYGLMHQLIGACQRSDELMLDLVDAALHFLPPPRKKTSELSTVLTSAGSVWKVADDGNSIMRRVDAAATESFRFATANQDLASKELEQAWGAAYGRASDASDTWDHAIKAVEAALIPVVVPRQHNAQLGHVIGQLDRQGDRWRLVLSPTQGISSIETLTGMLRLMWPNPDRHGSADSSEPLIDQARAVLHLAILIVQWVRQDAIRAVDPGASTVDP